MVVVVVGGGRRRAAVEGLDEVRGVRVAAQRLENRHLPFNRFGKQNHSANGYLANACREAVVLMRQTRVVTSSRTSADVVSSLLMNLIATFLPVLFSTAAWTTEKLPSPILHAPNQTSTDFLQKQYKFKKVL